MDKRNKEILQELEGQLGNYEAACLLNVLEYGYAMETHLNILSKLKELGVDQGVYNHWLTGQIDLIKLIGE